MRRTDAQDPAGAYSKLIQIPDVTTWKILLTYFAGQAGIMLTVPGTRFEGPLSPMGNKPVYKAHGLQCYFVSLAIYAGLYYNGVFTGLLIYEQMGKIYTGLVMVAFVLCFFLWIKGHVAPTYVGWRARLAPGSVEGGEAARPVTLTRGQSQPRSEPDHAHGPGTTTRARPATRSWTFTGAWSCTRAFSALTSSTTSAAASA